MLTMMARKIAVSWFMCFFYSACLNFLGILYHPIHLKRREKLDLISSNVLPVPERRPDEFFLDDDVMVKAEGLAT